MLAVGFVPAATGRGPLAGLDFGGGTRSSRFRVGIGMTRRTDGFAGDAVDEGAAAGAGASGSGVVSASPGDGVSGWGEPGGGTFKLGSFRIGISPRLSPQCNYGAGG
jgi:hypothetical protein